MAHIRLGEELFNVMIDGRRDAPVVLMSNSLGTDLRMWDTQIPELINHFRVIRYDSRGHGLSVAEPGHYSIDKLGRDALAILDKLGIEKAHFVGLSMGGMVGQWLLAHAPTRINRAVLANTSAHQDVPDVWNARAKTARDQGMEALADGTLERWFTKNFRAKNQKVIADVRAMIVATPPQGYAACCLAIRDMDQRQSVKSIRRPVLVIVGKHDPATIPEHGQLIANSIPGARILALDAAHMSNIEAPGNFTAAVVGFLQGRTVGEPARLIDPPPAPRPPAPKPVAPTPPVPNPPAKVAAAPLPAPAAATPEPKRKSPPAAKPPAKTKPANVPAAKAKPAAAKAKPKSKPPAKKPAVKKSGAKSTAAKKPVRGAKAAAKKSAAKKTRPAGKKSAAPKNAARKSAARKPAARSASAKRPPAKKSGAKKSARGR